MEKDQLYQIMDLKDENGNVQAKITFNAAHPIYDGHFPSHPVTPGVCQVQIVKDAISRIKGKPLFLSEAKVIKFLSMLTPGEEDVKLELHYSEQEDGVKVTSQLRSDDKVFSKLSGVFVSKL